MVGLWVWIRLVRAVVREKGNLGMFQFHHNPHPKTSVHPSQTNQVRNQVRSLVKSLIPSLSPDQSVSIVSFVEKMVTRESFAIRERERREWLRSGRTRIGTTFLMVCLSLVCHCLRERALCIRIRHGEM
jgi:type III secretory pathway lipoprotein EscJ